MNTDTTSEPPLPDSSPCEPESYKAFQRASEKRLHVCRVPKPGATRWTDSKGQRYERLKNGQIVRASA